MAENSNSILATFKNRLAAAFNRKEWSKLLFGQVKLPTFILVLWGIFLLVPSVREAIQFWWDAGIYLGGYMGLTGAILTSPWFGLFLIAAGIAYQLFVDENKRPTVQHIWWPYLAWGAVGLLVMAAFVVSIVSYINAAIGPRHLYPKQKQAIAAVLRTYPPNNPVFVKLTNVGSCFDCDGYALDFQDVIGAVPNWKVADTSSVLGVSRFDISPSGVSIRVADANNLSEGTKVFLEALHAADIPFGVYGGNTHMWPLDFELLISPRSNQ